ncbi:MAG: hypothetical protein RI897_2730 [Verrucomicrobiota bacterium]
MAGVGLGDADDFGFGESLAEGAAEVAEDDLTSVGEDFVEGFAVPGDVDGVGLGLDGGGGGLAGVGEGDVDFPDPVLVHDRAGDGAGVDGGGADGAAVDGEVVEVDTAEGGFAGEEFEAGFLGGEACGEGGGAAGAMSGVGEFLGAEEVGEVLGVGGMEEAFHAVDLDRIDGLGGVVVGGDHWASAGVPARTATATFIPPKPRQRTMAVLERGWVVWVVKGRWLKAGSISRVGVMAGTVLCWRARRVRTRSMVPAAAMRWPKAHLKAVMGGGLWGQMDWMAAASEASEVRVPLPWVTMKPISSGERLAFSRASWMARAGPSPSGRISTTPVASVVQPDPRYSPRMGVLRCWASVLVSRTREAAPSPKMVPERWVSKGRSVSGLRRPRFW